jgi:hypothetical protein
MPSNLCTRIDDAGWPPRHRGSSSGPSCALEVHRIVQPLIRFRIYAFNCHISMLTRASVFIQMVPDRGGRILRGYRRDISAGVRRGEIRIGLNVLLTKTIARSNSRTCTCGEYSILPVSGSPISLSQMSKNGSLAKISNSSVGCV